MSSPSSQPVFRFAPSPNGYLHFGHAYSAIFTWEAARAAGGVVLLRIEDIDLARCKPEYEAAIYDDLGWLGLDWSEPAMRQSTRFAEYEAAAKSLGDLLYPCTCSRAEIAAAATATDPEGQPRYPGTCRHRGPEPGKPVQLRLDVDRAVQRTGPCVIREHPVTDTAVLFETLNEREARPEDWGDVVIVRKEIPTSYHLAVVVDDAAEGVTNVTRGMDLHRATDIHVVLQKLLGLPSPVYAHHGLVTDRMDVKWSKSLNAPRFRIRGEDGWTPEQIRRRLGFPPT